MDSPDLAGSDLCLENTGAVVVELPLLTDVGGLTRRPVCLVKLVLPDGGGIALLLTIPVAVFVVAGFLMGFCILLEEAGGFSCWVGLANLLPPGPAGLEGKRLLCCLGSFKDLKRKRTKKELLKKNDYLYTYRKCICVMEKKFFIK